MNFILLTDCYDPIVRSGAIIIGDLANELIKQGNFVTIVTFVDTQKKNYEITLNNNLTVIRIKTFSRPMGKIGRLWAEIHYSSKIIKTFKSMNDIKCDLIICYSPSIFYGPAVKVLKNKYNSKAYLIIRDIFPKWALDSGLLKNNLLYKYFKSVEKDLYRSIDIIGIEAHSDYKYFENYGLDMDTKIEVLNNWGGALEEFDEHFPNDLLDSKKINIVYGGNMGDAQDLLALVNMIDFSILGERAHLFLIGSGNQFDKIKNTILRKNLLNVTLLPPFNRKKYLSIMAKADIGLVSLSNKLSSNNYPLKMIGYMQLSKPILASVNKNNEIISMIQDNNIGFASNALDKESFDNNLDIMLTNIALRKKQGKNALELFNKEFTAEVATRKILLNFM